MSAKPILTITVNPALDLTAVVHSFQVGSVNRIHSQQEDAGGKGINVASFLADFNVPVCATGFLGEENAEPFRSLFKAKGIRDDFIAVKGRTRSNIKLIDESQGAKGITDLNFPGFVITESDLEALNQRIDRIASTFSCCVIAGSLPENYAPESLQQLVARIKNMGIKVVLDSSGKALEAALQAKPHVIKPNQEELGAILGRELKSLADVTGAANDLLSSGIETVIVSMGEKGAVFCQAGESLLAKVPPCPVRSTVGAGDAMVAGYVLGHRRGLDLGETAKLATAFSLGAISQLGPRLPPRDTIEALAKTVSIERLS